MERSFNTELPALLRGVQPGKRHTITLRGEAVVDLVPAKGAGWHDAAAAIDEMKRFMAEMPVKGVDIRALVEQGRA